MISINATLVIQVINFLILVFILNRLMFRPIQKLVNERSQYIDKIKNNITNTETEITLLASKYLSKEKDIRKDAAEERTKRKKEAIDIAEKIFNATRKEVFLIKDEIQKGVDGEVAKAHQALHIEAQTLAEEIMEKVIGRRVA